MITTDISELQNRIDTKLLLQIKNADHSLLDIYNGKNSILYPITYSNTKDAFQISAWAQLSYSKPTYGIVAHYQLENVLLNPHDINPTKFLKLPMIDSDRPLFMAQISSRYPEHQHQGITFKLIKEAFIQLEKRKPCLHVVALTRGAVKNWRNEYLNQGYVYANYTHPELRPESLELSTWLYRLYK